MFAGICFLGLILYGCGGSSPGETVDQNDVAVTLSEDPSTEPPGSSTAVKAGIYDSTVVEGADDLEFVVSLSAAAGKTVNIDYSTVDGEAVAGEDYIATAGTLTFNPGEVRKFITVPVLENVSAQATSSKTLRLDLTAPRSVELIDDEGSGTIIDRNTMPTEAAFDENWPAVGVFTGAKTCSDCHRSDGTIMQYDGKDISPGTQWKHSVMAHAFNDPYWQAAVQDEVGNFPHLASFIEDKCTSCHAPMGRTHAHHLDENKEYRFDTAKDEYLAREGVSCTVCHQIREGGTDSGGYLISDSDKIIYGPYAAPLINPMSFVSGYAPQHNLHIQTSQMCAGCHTLYPPAIDPETGSPSGPGTGLASAARGFLEQGPFLEWQNSVYASGQPHEAQCQDCHMPTPADNYSTQISIRPNPSGGNAPPSREPFSQHTLLGGNAHLLEILRDYRSELGIDGSTSEQGFDDQIAQTRNFLGSSANLSISEPQTLGDGLRFDVEVSTQAGHKIPSAYPSRRSWLHVRVEDGAGSVVFESGRPDSRGYLSTDKARLRADCMAGEKLPGFDSLLCFEPHRDIIDDSSQVAIYETVLGDINGTITHTLLYGAQYLKDNRIPPAGFSNSKAATIDIQTVPVGVDGDGDFNCAAFAEGCGADTVHYRIDVAGHSGPYRVEARLLYQATQPGFVNGMHTDGDLVNRFKVMYDNVPPSVEVLASASK